MVNSPCRLVITKFRLPFLAITLLAQLANYRMEQPCLTAEQRERMKKAMTSDSPVFIVTQAEAEAKGETRVRNRLKTWTFKAKNVRDFAFATSRKFIWDAQNQKVGDKNVLCMSYYPKEGNPLWERYSTKLVAHTIKTYSKYTD